MDTVVPRAQAITSLAAPADVSHFRGLLRLMLARAGVPAELAEDVLLAAQEACNNAVLHCGGRAAEAGATIAGGRVVIEVRDHGGGFDAAARAAGDPGALDARGRGLLLMRRLMDSLEIVTSADGTLVRMTKGVARLPADAA